MDVLIALGTSVAYLYSVLVVFAPQLLPVGIDERGVYFEVSAVVIAFVLMGKTMEEIIKQRSSAAVRRLLDLQPDTATVIRQGQEISVPAETVACGDVVVVRPGETVPTDGIVLEGESSVDEALITGESLPVSKQQGSELIGGSLNGRGLLRLTATRVGADTALAQIIRIVEEAQASSAPVQRLADQVIAWFVPAVVAAAFLALALWTLAEQFSQGLLAFIAVLVISCPCALGIATPAALMVGVGKPALTRVIPLAEPSPERVLRLAASLEHGSEHPLASALLEAAAAQGLELLPAAAFQAQVGEGGQAQAGSQALWLGNGR